jgi:CobQ-like glutamine amidotransferase family enzyme
MVVKNSNSGKTIKIGHLYPEQMNVYGDMGNISTLRYRLEARGYKVEYCPLDSASEVIKMKPDIIVGGGGQDSNQDLVQADLMNNKRLINNLANNGVVMLMICGMYQLFGRKFIVEDGHEIEGIGVFDMETVANEDRLVGNVVVESDYGQLSGFENHSGRTILAHGVQPLGSVIKGAGNSDSTTDEGVVVNNVFGSYMHGPLLAKNPELADELIKRVLVNKYGKADLEPLDDEFEREAARVAAKRPR